MPTATANRKVLYEKIHSLPDNAIIKLIDFIDSIYIDEIDEHEPNAATLEAMREAEHPEHLKSYSSIEEMFRDFRVNVDN